MKKYELYPDYHDLFEYRGKKEIERIRIKGGLPVRRDWYVFETEDEAIFYFIKRCGIRTRYFN
ncbi:MAG: hypothetical protein PVJ84_16025 [Desulfobacteraceae bacterium]